MAVVDVSMVTDGFDAERVVTAIPRNDGAVISRPENVIGARAAHPPSII
jgi:hypothetical protein